MKKNAIDDIGRPKFKGNMRWSCIEEIVIDDLRRS